MLSRPWEFGCQEKSEFELRVRVLAVELLPFAGHNAAEGHLKN